MGEGDNSGAIVPSGAALMVRPAINAAEWKKQRKDWEELKSALIDPKIDVLIVKEKGADGQDVERAFLKKSFWRNAGLAFTLRVYQINEIRQSVECDPDKCPPSCGGRHYEVLAMYRAEHPCGAYADGDGSTIDNEKWGVPKPITENQVNAIGNAFRKRNADAGAFADQVLALTNGRTSQIRELSKDDASAFMDYLFGKNPLLTPGRPRRNSRHNVRAGANTRAYNRAVSNLIGGGEVSAEEIDIDALQDRRDDVIEGEYTERGAPPANGGRQAPAAQPPAQAPPDRMTPETFQQIADLGKVLKYSKARMHQAVHDITKGRTESLNDLTAAEGLSLRDNLQALHDVLAADEGAGEKAEPKAEKKADAPAEETKKPEDKSGAPAPGLPLN